MKHLPTTAIGHSLHSNRRFFMTFFGSSDLWPSGCIFRPRIQLAILVARQKLQRIGWFLEQFDVSNWRGFSQRSLCHRWFPWFFNEMRWYDIWVISHLATWQYMVSLCCEVESRVCPLPGRLRSYEVWFVIETIPPNRTKELLHRHLWRQAVFGWMTCSWNHKEFQAFKLSDVGWRFAIRK